MSDKFLIPSDENADREWLRMWRVPEAAIDEIVLEFKKLRAENANLKMDIVKLDALSKHFGNPNLI